MTVIEELLYIDGTLKLLSEWRRRAGEGDNIKEAEALDVEWRTMDEKRQELRGRMSDKELTAYEVARAKMAEKST